MRQIAIGLTLSLVALASTAFGQPETAQQITAVQFQGLERISEQLVRSKVEVQVGQAYNPRAVARDIRRLYDQGYFTSIKVDAAPSAGGVALTFVVEEKRVIDEIKIIGNDKVNDRRVRAVLSWREGDPFLADGYYEEREAILNLYATKGFANAQVDIVAEKIGPSRVRITYIIDEGKKARIKDIEFVGNDAIGDRQLRKIMKTARSWWFLGGKYDENQFEQDLENIVDVYGNVGRLEAEIPDTDVVYTESGKGMSITVHVSEGPEYTVDSLEVADNTVYDDDEILNIVKVHAGEIHNKGQVQDDAALVQKGYQDSGYVDAEVTPQVTVDREAKTTHIIHDISEGDMKYIRQVKISGNEVTKDEVIRRQILLRPGDRFDGGTLQLSQRSVENTQYFDTVRMSLDDVVDQPLYTDLLVDVEEGNTGNFNFGVGYNTEEGIGGFTELKLNNFDISNWPRFSGGGQQFTAKINIGDTRDSYALGFTDPQIFGYPLSFGFDVFDESYRVRGGADYDQRQTGGQLRFGKSLSPFTTTRWNLLYEDTQLSDFPLQFLLNPQLRSLSDDSTTISVGWSIERNTTNNYLDPSDGSTHKLAAQLAGLGGDNEFLKLEHDSSWYIPLSEEKKWVLSFRTREGWITPYGSQDEIRLQDRYYVGGTTTVRGYENRDIGPKTKTFLFWGDDFRLGGEARLVQNLEVKYKLNDMFRVYGFTDAGGVWYEASDFDFGDMKYSVGLGIGVDVPRMGPVRLDYGFPLNPDDDQGSGRLHLTTGFRF